MQGRVEDSRLIMIIKLAAGSSSPACNGRGLRLCLKCLSSSNDRCTTPPHRAPHIRHQIRVLLHAHAQPHQVLPNTQQLPLSGRDGLMRHRHGVLGQTLDASQRLSECEQAQGGEERVGRWELCGTSQWSWR